MSKPLRPNSTQVPDEILDKWMAELSGAEFKVIMYIVRRTYGFQKEGDTISLRQIVGGIVKRDGTRLDAGTGLNKDTVCKALASLEKRAFIYRENRKDETGDLPNFYRLNLEAGSCRTSNPESENPTGEGGENLGTPVAESDTPGVGKAAPGSVVFSDRPQSIIPTQQQTALQQAVLQDTATTGGPVAAALLPSAGGEGVEMLVASGFSRDDASIIAAACSIDTIRRQVDWLPERKVTGNRLGLLRRSIEQDWRRPAVQHPAPASAVGKTNLGTSLDASQRKAADQLRALYSRLAAEAPETFAELEAFTEEARQQEGLKPLLRNNPKRLETVVRSYDFEEKRIEVMVKFFQDKDIPIPEFTSLIRDLRRTPFPSSQFFRPAAYAS